MESIVQSLKAQWDALKAQEPRIRIREAAKRLDVSEAELLATGLGTNVVRLNNQFKELLKEAGTLGRVMALTRNEYCVHERNGIYKKAVFNGHVGLVVTPDIDLRLFMNHWHFGFAVNESERYSLQFFDKNGEAVHKIYLTEESDREAYDRLVGRYRAVDQQEEMIIVPDELSAVELPGEPADISGFQEGWKALQDTHDFHPLLRRFGLTRTQALLHAPAGYAYRVEAVRLKTMLENAAASGLEIMVFTGSAGCIQIHTGPVKKLLETGPWYNVLDPHFNMHLRLEGIAELWLVKKPTKDGLVHSLEAYDAAGNTIVQFFGKRKPGIPESEGWRTLLQNIFHI